MSKEEIKKINAEISKECFKKIKIMAIQKDISLAECFTEILERSVSKKTIEEMAT